MEQITTPIYPDRVSNLKEAIFPKPPIYRDGIFITGLVLTGLSALVFIFPEFAGSRFDQSLEFGVFFFNYVVAVSYFFILLFSGLLKFKWTLTRNYTENIFLFLVLGLISAFALNREIPVFEKSADWLTISLVVLSATLVAICFRKQLPKPVLSGLYFLLGMGLVLYAYFSIYLLPFYPIGLVGAIILGFSLHVFVPLFSLIFIGIHFYKAMRQNPGLRYFGLAGIATPFIILGVFLIGWANVKDQVNFALNQSRAADELLPAWVAVSRILPKTPLAEKLIKTELVYHTPSKGRWRIFDMPRRAFNETRRHDPLVMISCLLLDQPDLTENERIKILESMYDSRHKTLEKLWSGEALSTANVNSNVLIYPNFRLAYTEKSLSIHNSESRSWSQQEAIYTFHLPEGGVVTSLSLWINGREEKGILTTKAKADSAYKTIVGVESRDPSVVHWQEGNTVSVRVFPCTPTENRRFKIGVTAPLRYEEGKLSYQNIYFDGPKSVGATETVQLRFSQTPLGLDLPFSFKKQDATEYVFNGGFRSYYEIAMEAPAINKAAFSFSGKSYRVLPYQKKYAPFEPGTIYLDLNGAWENADLPAIRKLLRGYKVFAFNGKMVRVTEENLPDIFEGLKQQNFSLFPFHLIANPANSLVISKSNSVSPGLKDLQGSQFAEQLKSTFQHSQKIKLFHLGPELSPYLKTLKELRGFNYDQGNWKDLQNLMQQQKFVVDQENERSLVIQNAGVQLLESDGKFPAGAPDHLLRLFTYNHLLQQIGSNYFTENFITEELLAEAQKAYVISPLSSLVVLETQADYDRFNIKDSQDQSLRNASMHGSGSVPEPHEWFLIILIAAVGLYLYFRSGFLVKFNR